MYDLIFLMEFNIYKIIIYHLQHIRFMSHVAYTTDNVIDTKVLIIKTNSLHMGKTQKHRANSLLQEKNNCFSDLHH